MIDTVTGVHGHELHFNVKQFTTLITIVVSNNFMILLTLFYFLITESTMAKAMKRLTAILNYMKKVKSIILLVCGQDF